MFESDESFYNHYLLVYKINNEQKTSILMFFGERKGVKKLGVYDCVNSQICLFHKHD